MCVNIMYDLHVIYIYINDDNDNYYDTYIYIYNDICIYASASGHPYLHHVVSTLNG